MNTTNKILILLLIFELIFSCNKADIDDSSSDCEDFISSSPFGFYLNSFPPFLYIKPCFNPNDENEFIYVKLNSATMESDLYKYNLIDQTSTLLINNVSGYPQWGKTDWILFEMNDERLWKIKSNGDSLTLLISDGIYNDYATWNSSGDRFIFRLHYGDSVNSIISDIDGNYLLQTASIYYEGGAWNPNPEKIAYASELDQDYGIAWCDTNLSESHTFVFMASQNGDDILKGMAWLPDEENVMWSTGNTVSISNIYTGKTTQLFENCDAKKYIYPSISPDGTKVIFEKVVQNKLSEVELYIVNELVIMNIDGSDEEVILE